MSGRSCRSCGAVLLSDQDRCSDCGAYNEIRPAGWRRPLLAATAALVAIALGALIAYGAVRDDAERETSVSEPLTPAPSAPAGARDVPLPDALTPGAGQPSP
jgi:hypothetical protein